MTKRRERDIGDRLAAYAAARRWAAEHGHQTPDDRMLDIVYDAGYAAGLTHTYKPQAYEMCARCSGRGGDVDTGQPCTDCLSTGRIPFLVDNIHTLDSDGAS